MTASPFIFLHLSSTLFRCFKLDKTQTKWIFNRVLTFNQLIGFLWYSLKKSATHGKRNKIVKFRFSTAQLDRNTMRPSFLGSLSRNPFYTTRLNYTLCWKKKEDKKKQKKCACVCVFDSVCMYAFSNIGCLYNDVCVALVACACF